MAEADITIGQRMDRAKHMATEFKESAAYDRRRPVSRQILRSEMRSDLNEEDSPLAKEKLCILLKGEYRRLESSKFAGLFIEDLFQADVSGSLEALKHLFSKFESEDKKIEITFSAVGPVTESDVMLAATIKGGYK
jgi:translation initiation factor IF-2